MAEELRLALILLGSLAIGAVILHGIWTVRKTVNEERAQSQKETPEVQEEDIDEDLDSQGLKLKQMEMDFNLLQQPSEQGQGLPVVDVNLDAIYNDKSPQATGEFPQSEELSTDDIVLSTADHNEETDHEPHIGNFSALEHDDVDDVQVTIAAHDDLQEATSQPAKQRVQQEVLMLFVDKEQGPEIEGAKLLPLLLTLGFKFGEMDFFHRHQDSSGKGEVLFSLANMYNPGTFDIDNMEQMSTRGLTIFMTLPNAAEPLQTFNMMHNAAKKIADEFGARVLDHNRQPIDVAIVRGYVEKIRKFQGH